MSETITIFAPPSHSDYGDHALEDAQQATHAIATRANQRSLPTISATPQIGRPVVVDLCSGLGGISLAARQLGMCIAAGVDLTKDALRTFNKNFPEAESIEGTVTGSKAIEECAKAIAARRTTGAPLIIVSGPPCQGFSAAGPRDPKDKRNKVFLGVARMIATLKPDCALVENVQMPCYTRR